MVLPDLVSELFGRDEVPDERLDLLVALVDVDAVEQGHPEGVFNVLRLETFSKMSVTDHFLPTTPAERFHQN